jgi:hypothetical protein
MPILFDFNQSSRVTSFGGLDTQSMSEDYTASGTTVTFTFSSDDADVKSGVIGGNTGPFGMSIRDNGQDNSFTLAFVTSGPTANPWISGSAGDPIILQAGFVNGSWDVSFLTEGAGGVIGTVAGGSITGNGQTVQNTSLTNVVGIRFTSTSGSGTDDRIELDSLSVKGFNCFCAGTRIATADGWKLVEDIEAGDKVLRAEGGETEVKWLGRQSVDTRFAHPKLASPIRIRKGALGDNLPERDLRLSGDHAIGIDGLLVTASALVNGTTIIQEPDMPIDGFTYYHVETEAHELILAEGLPSESFVDFNGQTFDNAHERPDDRTIAEMDRPRVTSARLLPPSLKGLVAA